MAANQSTKARGRSRMRGFIHKLPLFCICLLVAGCGIEIYGKADRYDQHNNPDFVVVIPPNAPFISEQFVSGDDIGDKNHLGIDIWGKRGSEILAAAPGRVKRSFYDPAFGNQIVLDHGLDDKGTRILTHYKHLYERLAEAGDVIARGQQIGTMGATGALGMMVHLHFEVQFDEPHREIKALDPNLFWMDGAGKITCFDRTAQYRDRPFKTTYPVRCKGM